MLQRPNGAEPMRVKTGADWGLGLGLGLTW